ncbi:family 43 glycosylhydrolase [Knoellia sp. CPCC 206450]|uniref:family 43 glycosylhydrolase n=1 Tax=Knoellia tibetensis TaxID=3404798 RepID=UPI003B430B10
MTDSTPTQPPGPGPTTSFRRARTLLAPLTAMVALLLATAGAAAASPTAAPAAASKAKPVTTTYENPLAPDIPGDGTVDSCADPMIIKGQDGETIDGKQVWYMYCTTDPLNDEDVDAAGNPVFHRIPMNVSTDLVNWTYVGDAFPLDGGDTPDWIGPRAAFWAPEVVYSEATDQYYLFVTVTDTTAAGGGSADPNCTGDSAIGVAVGDSPTGPWTFTDAPVVAPRSNGPGCNYFWTYDPDVLGDTVGSQGVLYYGSYYGGMFATPITFGPGDQVSTGTTADDTQIAIANRYEGANVVYKDGYYYLFASATNCCNGALTGYSVFVGRSTSPYGPFLDQEGNSFLEANVGGTPFLTMNGNRWIGTGHNSVFVDEGGQWWTVYHAVDQEDPFYAFQTGFTKRPALLDPVDWVDGWPVVNGGYMASDTKMPAPAAQPGERTRYRPKLLKPDTVNRLIDRDEFSGSTLDGDWSWAEGRVGDAAVTDGVLRWEVEHTDLYVDSNTASVLVRDAPSGDYVVETKVRLEGLPDDGCCFNYAQAGLVIYEDDDNFIKLTSASIWETRQTEFAKELSPVPEGWSRYGNTVVGPPGDDDDPVAQSDWTYLRIVVERLTGAEQAAAGGDTERYTAYTSQDGTTWVRGGTWTHSLGQDALIGLVSMGATDQVTSPITAEFDYVRVYGLKGTARPQP